MRDLPKRASALLVLGALTACAGKEVPSHRAVVRVESDPGKPLAGARISYGGKHAGTSDEAGVVALELLGRPGDVVTLDTSCPDGHRPPSESVSVVLRPLRDPGKSPEYHVRCRPLTRAVVISVRAQDGPHLPVRYLGREIARTDAAGAAHALLHVPWGETITVTLDTSGAEHSALMPQNPELKLMVPDRDEIVLFDQSFSRPKERRAKRRAPAPRGPQRI